MPVTIVGGTRVDHERIMRNHAQLLRRSEPSQTMKYYDDKHNGGLALMEKPKLMPHVVVITHELHPDVKYCPYCSCGGHAYELWNSTSKAKHCPNCKLWIDVETKERWRMDDRSLCRKIVDVVKGHFFGNGRVKA